MNQTTLHKCPIVAYSFNAKIVRIIDADTLALDADLGFRVHRELVVRLADVNAYERHTDLGKLATKWVEDLAIGHGKKCVIESHKTGKYGRWIAQVWFGDFNLNQGLLDSGFAVPYE